LARQSLPRTQKPEGRTRFYADENVDEAVIRWLRAQKYHVESARELGYSKRDDEFHLQEAARRGCILLSNDVDYLDDRRFPFHRLTGTGVVVMHTSDRPAGRLQYGFMLVALEREIGKSGTANLLGLKVELRGPRVVLRARVGGRIRSDEFDVSQPIQDRELFSDER